MMAPLLDIVLKDKQMKDFDRNIIFLTDGQVSNTQEVIEILRSMKKKNIATTHMVGVGNGVSFDLIKRGAMAGSGEHLFIMKEEEMQKQVIYLLELITKFQIKNFNLEYNQSLITCTEPLIPSVLKKLKPNTFYLKFKAPLSPELLTNEKIVVHYFDE